MGFPILVRCIFILNQPPGHNKKCIIDDYHCVFLFELMIWVCVNMYVVYEQINTCSKNSLYFHTHSTLKTLGRHKNCDLIVSDKWLGSKLYQKQ